VYERGARGVREGVERGARGVVRDALRRWHVARKPLWNWELAGETGDWVVEKRYVFFAAVRDEEENRSR